MPQFLELPASIDDDPDEPVEPIPPGGEFPEMKFESHLYRYTSITVTTIGNAPRTTRMIARYRYVPPSEV